MTMKYNDCETANLLHEKLKEVYEGRHVDKDRIMNDRGVVEVYYFNVWKNYTRDWVPMAVITYDDIFKRAFIATSSDGTLEKEIIGFFNKKAIKCGIEANIQENCLDIVSIPFSKINEL